MLQQGLKSVFSVYFYISIFILLSRKQREVRNSLKSLRLRNLLSLHSLTGPHWSLLSEICLAYIALLGLTGPYLASLGLTKPYWALLGLTGPYWALLGLTRPYWALLSLTKPY